MKYVAISEEQKKVSSLQKILLGGGLGLSLLALGFGFYGFKQKAQRNKPEKEKIEVEPAFKKKEPTTHALHMAKKNEVLEQVKRLWVKANKHDTGAALTGDEISAQFHFNGFQGHMTEIGSDYIEITCRGIATMDKIFELKSDVQEVIPIQH